MKPTKEFQNLAFEEIRLRLRELKKELMKENVHISSGTASSNPGKIKQTKKNIARLLGILSQKTRISAPETEEKQKNKRKGTKKRIKRTNRR